MGAVLVQRPGGGSFGFRTSAVRRLRAGLRWARGPDRKRSPGRGSREGLTLGAGAAAQGGRGGSRCRLRSPGKAPDSGGGDGDSRDAVARTPPAGTAGRRTAPELVVTGHESCGLSCSWLGVTAGPAWVATGVAGSLSRSRGGRTPPTVPSGTRDTNARTRPGAW